MNNSPTSALKEALSTFTCLINNDYQNKTIGMVKYGVFSCQCYFDDPCGNSCVNKELMIECDEDSCPVSNTCQNRRFQQQEYKKIDIVTTKKKGFGVIAKQDIHANEFIVEYLGEYITEHKFQQRAQHYGKGNQKHFYGMSLRSNEYVDATKKGGIARFCNHSCNPNCIIQQWIVNGRLRMGLFAIRDISLDEELTFDYNFERFGVPQKCFCNESNCRGYIGQTNENLSKIKLAKVKATHQFKKGRSPFLNESDIIDACRHFLKDLQSIEFESFLYRLLNSDKSYYFSFINSHGLYILKHVLLEFKNEYFYSDLLDFCFNLPLTRKNYLIRTGLLETVQRLELNTLYSKWNDLKLDIIIKKTRIPPQTNNSLVLISPIKLIKDTSNTCYQHKGVFYEHISGKQSTKLHSTTLSQLKKSFQSDPSQLHAYKSFKSNICTIVVDKLTKYASEWKNDKMTFKAHAKKITDTILDKELLKHNHIPIWNPLYDDKIKLFVKKYIGFHRQQ